VRGRIAEFLDPNETSTAIHFQLWRTAAGYANESPIFGGGPYSFVERSRNMIDFADEPAHSFFFEAAADTGWLGAAYTTLLTLAILRYGWRRLRAAPVMEFALWTGLAATVAMNPTMNGFREDMWWVWGGLTIAVASTHAVAPARPDAP
jgi:O-antigen ligase